MAETTEAVHNEAITCKIQGNINYRQGNYKDALIFYEKGLQVDPDNIDIWNNKGLALVKLGRIEEARQCKMQLKRLGENPGATQTISPVVTVQETETPRQCTIKIKGVEEPVEIPKNRTVQVIPEVPENSLHSGLQIRDIEQNIDLIQRGLDQVRLGRIEEAKQCKIQIKEMEDTIEQTKQGLNLVKKGRMEEARKIKYIEEHIELTKKGLELIKIGRIEEATHYKQQLKAIEENIEMTRKSLMQVETETAGTTPGIKTNRENNDITRRENVPVMPVAAEGGTGRTHQIKDIEDIIALPSETDQPVTPGKIRVASILFIFFVVIILGYFAFFK